VYPAEGEDLERSSLIVVPSRIRNRNVVSPSKYQCKTITGRGILLRSPIDKAEASSKPSIAGAAGEPGDNSAWW
jgi:hypothetical protein